MLVRRLAVELNKANCDGLRYIPSKIAEGYLKFTWNSMSLFSLNCLGNIASEVFMSTATVKRGQPRCSPGLD